MGKKHCYGVLEIVFPLTKRGIREVPPDCFHCDDRVACMKSALSTEEGFQLRSERFEQSEESRGFLGRLRRWSRKKEQYRLMEKQKKS